MRALCGNLQRVKRALQQDGDDRRMIVEDYVENGATQVKFSRSVSCSFYLYLLPPDEINYQFPQSDLCPSGDGDGPGERLLPVKTADKQNQGTMNYSIWRRRE